MASCRESPDAGTGPAIPSPARGPAVPTQARDTEQRPVERVNKPGELWRTEGSLNAVRAKIAQLESLDDSVLRSRVSELERRWRAQLAAPGRSSRTDDSHRARPRRWRPTAHRSRRGP